MQRRKKEIFPFEVIGIIGSLSERFMTKRRIMKNWSACVHRYRSYSHQNKFPHPQFFREILLKRRAENSWNFLFLCWMLGWIDDYEYYSKKKSTLLVFGAFLDSFCGFCRLPVRRWVSSILSTDKGFDIDICKFWEHFVRFLLAANAWLFGLCCFYIDILQYKYI